MFAPSYFGKLLGCKSHTLKQPKAVESAFKAICAQFGHFSAESDWIIHVVHKHIDLQSSHWSVYAAFPLEETSWQPSTCVLVSSGLLVVAR